MTGQLFSIFVRLNSTTELTILVHTDTQINIVIHNDTETEYIDLDEYMLMKELGVIHSKGRNRTIYS